MKKSRRIFFLFLTTLALPSCSFSPSQQVKKIVHDQDYEHTVGKMEENGEPLYVNPDIDAPSSDYSSFSGYILCPRAKRVYDRCVHRIPSYPQQSPGRRMELRKSHCRIEAMRYEQCLRLNKSEHILVNPFSRYKEE